MLKKITLFAATTLLFTAIQSIPLLTTIGTSVSNNKRLTLAAGSFLLSRNQTTSNFLKKYTTISGYELGYNGLYGVCMQLLGKALPQNQKALNHTFDLAASLFLSYKIFNALPYGKQLKPQSDEDFIKKSAHEKNEKNVEIFGSICATVGGIGALQILYNLLPTKIQKTGFWGLFALNSCLLLKGPSFFMQTAGWCGVIAQGLSISKYAPNGKILAALALAAHYYMNSADIHSQNTNFENLNLLNNLFKKPTDNDIKKVSINNIFDKLRDINSEEHFTLVLLKGHQILSDILQESYKHLVSTTLIASGAYGLRLLAKNIAH